MNQQKQCQRAAAVMAAAVVLLTAACGGSPNTGGSASSPQASSPQASTRASSQASPQSALAFSRCVRSHGVPNFPDPPVPFNGKFPGSGPQQLGVSQSRIQTAVQACQNLLPQLPGQAPLTAQEQQDYLRAAACMRSHGITVFPDPVFSGGTVHFPIPSSNVDTTSPQFTQAEQICKRMIPAGLPYSASGG